MRKMRRLVGLGVLVAVASGGAAVACRSVTCEENKTCTDGVTPDGDGGADGGPVGDGGTDGPVFPPGCEKSPTQGGALDEKCGVFVSPMGNDGTGAGTRESPVATVSQGVALAGNQAKAWVYVCKGTYKETAPVKVENRPLGLFGKLDCDSNWVAGETRATIEGMADEVVLSFQGATVRLEGVDVRAKDATKGGGSSIAIFAKDGQLDVVDSVVQAGKGMDGDAGASGGAQLPKQDAGNNGDSPGGGPSAICLCNGSDAGTVGGAGGTAVVSAENGTAGAPSRGIPEAGAGGTGGLVSCAAMGAAALGKDGANGPDGGLGAHAAKAGELMLDGWRPAAGAEATDGKVGQGGGGGGAISGGGGGGSGGCGGCGGRPGTGGAGGGASATIVSLGTKVTVSRSELVTRGAGRGGPGGAGQPGQQGGNGGNGANGSCQGGAGGNGGPGGAGGGGAGGVSAAFLYKGPPAPERDAVTKVTLGDAGAPGAPGAFSSPPVEKLEVP